MVADVLLRHSDDFCSSCRLRLSTCREHKVGLFRCAPCCRHPFPVSAADYGELKAGWSNPALSLQALLDGEAVKCVCRFLLLIAASAAGVMASLAPPLAGAADLTDYVVQSLCVDEAGGPVDRLPIDAACVRRRMQRADDVAVYRKHDWPNRLDEPTTVLGFQASDSVVDRRGGRVIVVQTFDFGTGGRSFGTFDGGRGDGGQVLLLLGDWASFAMTEDGGGGVQWFLGEACRSAVGGDARFLGWLVARRDVDGHAWRETVAKLNIAATPSACPGRFNAAFTRFRLVSLELPFRIVEGPLPTRSSFVGLSRVALSAVVSEHYGGHDIRSADHLERSYFAQGLGLVRWERWANANIWQPPAVLEASRLLAATARCPAVGGYGAPVTGWLLADCRTWTTLVRQAVPWGVRNYRWPALAGLGAVD
jgi:hypothetical protein